jgi:RimJ/RimL family protein N-acetyltransferase
MRPHDSRTAPHVSLERLGERHLADLEALTADADVLRFTRVPDPVPEGFARAWIERYEAGHLDGTCAGFAAVDEEGRFLGLGVGLDIDPEARELELGYIVAASARGRGVASELLRLLTDWALDELGAQRIVLIVDVDNAASSRVAARGGYTREGVMRSLFIKPGVRRDAELWSLLPADKPALTDRHRETGGECDLCENPRVYTAEAAIETERLRLRPFRESDLDDLHAMRSLPEVVRYLYGEVRSREQCEEMLAERLTQTSVAAEGDGLSLAVERREDGRVIGDLSLWLRSAEHRQGEIGFVFHPDAQGQGYAREAATALLAVAFGELGLHRVFGRTDGRNDASAALMRRLGMRQEAHFRENEMFKGAWGDELVFAVLESEWGA